MKQWSIIQFKKVERKLRISGVRRGLGGSKPREPEKIVVEK